jgi:hypothetical protein
MRRMRNAPPTRVATTAAGDHPRSSSERAREPESPKDEAEAHRHSSGRRPFGLLPEQRSSSPSPPQLPDHIPVMTKIEYTNDTKAHHVRSQVAF